MPFQVVVTEFFTLLMVVLLLILKWMLVLIWLWFLWFLFNRANWTTFWNSSSSSNIYSFCILKKTREKHELPYQNATHSINFGPRLLTFDRQKDTMNWLNVSFFPKKGARAMQSICRCYLFSGLNFIQPIK